MEVGVRKGDGCVSLELGLMGRGGRKDERAGFGSARMTGIGWTLNGMHRQTVQRMYVRAGACFSLVRARMPT